MRHGKLLCFISYENSKTCITITTTTITAAAAAAATTTIITIIQAFGQISDLLSVIPAFVF